MLSVVIPSFQDPFLQKTIDSLLENAQGEIEVIPVLDGYTPDTPIESDSRVRVITLPANQGMRGAINAGIAQAQGEYLMKCDSHCLFGQGFDKTLIENCAENWLVIPRRYSLDENRWQRIEKRPVRDYHYLTIPMFIKGYGICMSNQDWLRRGRERSDHKYDVDDTMTFQGSCWLANREHFMKRVGFLDYGRETYGPFGGEQMEVGLKYWLGGDEVKVIKKTWYAHLSKQPRHYKAGIFPRRYKNRQARGRTWAAKHWINNEELGMIHPFSWLVEKFWPVPTWPEDRSLWVFPK